MALVPLVEDVAAEALRVAVAACGLLRHQRNQCRLWTIRRRMGTRGALPTALGDAPHPRHTEIPHRSPGSTPEARVEPPPPHAEARLVPPSGSLTLHHADTRRRSEATAGAARPACPQPKTP